MGHATFQFTYFFFLLQIFIVPFTPTGRCEGDSGSSESSNCILYVCTKNADGDNRCNIDRLINQTGTICAVVGGGEANILSDGQTEARAVSILFEALENKVKRVSLHQRNNF